MQKVENEAKTSELDIHHHLLNQKTSPTSKYPDFKSQILIIQVSSAGFKAGNFAKITLNGF